MYVPSLSFNFNINHGGHACNSAAMNIFMVSCWDHTNDVHSESENQVLLNDFYSLQSQAITACD